MRVAIARPAEARGNTAFEGQLRCYEYLALEYDIEIDVFARRGAGLESDGDAVTIKECPATRVERLKHLGREARRRILRRSTVVMPEFSAVRPLIQHDDYDVVEVGDPTLYPAALAATRAAVGSGMRVVPMASATMSLPSNMSHSDAREIVEAASALIFVTPRAHERFTSENLVDSEDSRAVYTGHPIDTEHFSAGVSDREAEDPTHILSVGRLEKRKGFKLLCNVCRRLNEAGYSFRWHIAGGGELEAYVREFVRVHDIKEHVTLHGVVPHEEIPRLYANADFFALHSMATETWEEYFGVAYAEAMSSSLPVVASQSGAIPWVVRDGIDGILADEGDESAVFDACCQLITDADARRKMGENARENVESRFELEAVAEKFRGAWLKRRE